MATSATLRAVLIGLSPDHPLIPPHVKDLVVKGLEEVRVHMVDAGIQYEFAEVSPDESLDALGPKLQSLRPYAVVIGNGIRSNMKLTHFMEQIIDVVRTSVPEAKLLFNTSPEDTLDAVKRWFPIAAKST